MNLNSLNIDHILPESLLGTPQKLGNIIKDYGLNPEFKINSYHNWVPACRSCNLNKKDLIYSKNSVLHFLELARSRYAKVKQIESSLNKANSISKLTSNLKICLEKDLISYDKIPHLSLLLNDSNKDQLIFITNTFCSFIEQEKYRDAILYIEKVIKIFPEDKTGFSYHSLGFCYLQLKDYQSAINSCTKAIKANPGLGLAFLVRGQAYFLPYYNDFYEDIENKDLITRISRYGDDVIAFEHYNLAIKNYDNAIKILPDYPDSFYWRAICKSFLMVRFSTYFLGDEPLLLARIVEDLRKAAEIYFKGSKLSRCKETLRIYSELLEMHKDIFASYEDSKQLLDQWNSEYFTSASIQEE
ncbi:hypothetical protein NIES30_06730 [Phormidium tenue NIES-30]|uniref:HNH nuclease domain-containing protein n=1 Tax=Phormidium tenue NIES-30 TaxID=549789 RepID=A0A1U7J8H3_9CYAN|nr:hypothetical protein NIES30_06730 [Phormidium tenue NIES-30]